MKKIYWLTIIIIVLAPMIMNGNNTEEKSAGEYVSAGMTAYSSSEYAKAIEYFKKGHMLRPDNAAVVYNIACCYSLNGEADSALVWLARTIELGTYRFSDDPDFEPLHDNLVYKWLVAYAEKRIQELDAVEWLPVIMKPDDFDTTITYPAVIALHGFGSNPVDFAAATKDGVIQNGYLLCCPHGPEIRGRTAFGWGEPDAAEQRVMEALEYLESHYRVDEKKIVLLGYSQGGRYSFYIGLKHSAMFTGLISVAGYYDEELDGLLIEPRQTKVYMMIGEKDRSFASNRHAENSMGKAGLKVKLVSYPDLGHAFPSDSKTEVSRALYWVTCVKGKDAPCDD
jgi:phospholipase/carboxylesterase